MISFAKNGWDFKIYLYTFHFIFQMPFSMKPICTMKNGVIPQYLLEELKRKKTSKNCSELEALFARFPKLGVSISSELDDLSLIKLKNTTGEMNHFQRAERYFWIRMIQKYTKHMADLPESWRTVISKTPIGIIKELALMVEFYYKHHSLPIGKSNF